MPINKAELLAKIDSAKQVIADAERELSRLLGELDVMPRAKKQQVSDTVNKAFERLHETRADLAKLLDNVAKSDDD